MLTAADLERGALKPTWCPGCGNFGMYRALKEAIEELGLAAEELVMVWGIGCHGNGADFYNVQGFHGLHGRALPLATGIALTRPDLTVIVEMGDGDGYGIGGNHFLHSVRRNIDLTAIFHNNQIYGLTTGQASPTSDQFMRTPSTPGGVIEEPVNPVGVAVAQGATFVARGFAGDIPHLKELYKRAIQHKGFSLVDVYQPCVTWNKVNTFSWFRERIYKVEDLPDYDPRDRTKAFHLSMSTFHELTCAPDECRIPIGVFLEDPDSFTYQDGLPQLDRPMFKHAERPRDITQALEPYRV
ncbi:thiamine pyrophosphate-dependent enzyme [Coriobacteriia bacterium Es71-Z0120]|uniref:thiamine pyrophosphate-dependent enzyme n=1 Tax=Parvivirga hydrogeniphila TaxID=2939460 RepID=UPI002260EB22|nr:thiamine pyrophosphate-dependent enzyme [Parvivirga hydrogeniphila]MCL4079708.1 thiamine pyrophosphate-dependent enzyme [Parvivirga hydrogeniphila]